MCVCARASTREGQERDRITGVIQLVACARDVLCVCVTQVHREGEKQPNRRGGGALTGSSIPKCPAAADVPFTLSLGHTFKRCLRDELGIRIDGQPQPSPFEPMSPWTPGDYGYQPDDSPGLAERLRSAFPDVMPTPASGPATPWESLPEEYPPGFLELNNAYAHVFDPDVTPRAPAEYVPPGLF